MATKDLKKALGNLQQITRAVQWVKTVDFSEHNAASADIFQIMTLPAGFVFLACHAYLMTAEGGAGTIDIGVSGDVDGFLDGGDVNGTTNTLIASGGASATIAAGKLYATATDVQVTANAALDAAVVKIVFTGYMVDL